MNAHWYYVKILNDNIFSINGWNRMHRSPTSSRHNQSICRRYTIFERYWIFQAVPKLFKAVQMYWQTLAKYYPFKSTCPKRYKIAQVGSFHSKVWSFRWKNKIFLLGISIFRVIVILIFQIIWCSKLRNCFNSIGHHSTWIILVRSSALDLGTEWDNPVNICLRFRTVTNSFKIFQFIRRYLTR